MSAQQARARLRHLRVGPRKVRYVADLVRGKKVQQALDILSFSPRWAARPLRKLIDSALSNATENQGLDADRLVVRELQVDGGPILKRWQPRAMGRATRIRKRTSHVTVVLEETAR